MEIASHIAFISASDGCLRLKFLVLIIILCWNKEQVPQALSIPDFSYVEEVNKVVLEDFLPHRLGPVSKCKTVIFHLAG